MNRRTEEFPMLVADKGPLIGQRWALSRTLVLGRESTCDVVIADRQVSRFHARLTPTEEGIMVEDLGSKNGTHLNGVALTSPNMLKDGDKVQVGFVQEFLFFTSDATMPLTKTMPASMPSMKASCSAGLLDQTLAPRPNAVALAISMACPMSRARNSAATGPNSSSLQAGEFLGISASTVGS